MGRVLDGIRLSGMLRSEIALVLRKEQLHIFLCAFINWILSGKAVNLLKVSNTRGRRKFSIVS